MDVAGERVAVVGLGATAAAVARLLLREGARPFVTDSADSPKNAACAAELEALGVPYEVGGHTPAAFEDASLVIPSPGVPPGIEAIRRAREAGARVAGEMEFAFPYCRSRIVAVTGTNGKTTTTELLRALIESCGHSVLLAGNNDRPFSAAVLAEPASEYLVLEVSSYQLETACEFHPWAAAVLNVTPDHLARHGDLDTYAALKARIFANQREGDVAAINWDDPRVRGMAGGSPATVCPFSLDTRMEAGMWLDGDALRFGNETVARVSDTKLPGRHNLQNVLCALSLMRAGGFDWEAALAGLRTFEGVEHRIEFVAEIDGVPFYNDSKSTNIDSLKVALESFDQPIVLIAGGEGKGSDYGVLRNLVSKHVCTLVTLGEDAPAFEEAFGGVTATQRASDMDDAVRRAAEAAQPGTVVLLSPACASFDMYDNFEHRGHVFKQAVRDYREGRNS
ncbi:MAG: UDP-N-acetylmuramoyl-L-alanine--D-glutamate ligase [Nitrospiraceae bacterium]|nr:UDP-N-acetylmuramoyl-L-alanine--D-glutamate ligase [Nitrospiraceae bacterium]